MLFPFVKFKEYKLTFVPTAVVSSDSGYSHHLQQLEKKQSQTLHRDTQWLA